MTSWMSRRCALGVILVGPAAPGKVQHSSMFFPFVNNGSDHGSLESQSLRDGFKTISRLIHVNYFIIIYLIIVDSCICHDTCCEKYHKPSDTNGDIV